MMVLNRKGLVRRAFSVVPVGTLVDTEKAPKNN
jgi:hypothetical protein